MNHKQMEIRTGMMEENQQQSTSGLGTRLKKARESLHLSLKDAAVRLHLGPSMIQIIESEDFKKAPPPMFMRGYLRSYAKLLNVDVTDDEINLAFRQSGVDLEPKATLSPLLQTETLENTDRYVHIITMLVMAISLVLVGIWWKSHASSDALRTATQNPPITEPAPQPAIATNTAPPTVAPATAAAEPATAPPADETPALPAATNNTVATTTTPPTAVPNPTVPANTAPAENTTPSQPATVAAAPTAPAAPANGPEQPAIANTGPVAPTATAPETVTAEPGLLPLTPGALANAAPVEPTPDSDQPHKKRGRRHAADFDNRVSGMAMALPEPGL